MKKKLVKAVSVAMALTMTAGLATGCNSSSGPASSLQPRVLADSPINWLQQSPGHSRLLVQTEIPSGG